MLEPSLQFDALDRPSVLCIGAHCDDIEIGCGGSLLKLARTYPNTRFHWVVFCSDERRATETRAAAERLMRGAEHTIQLFEFRDGYLPWQGAEVKDALKAVAQSVSPDLVFTHTRDDSHQDHRLLCELTGNHFRDHLILEYEIPKYDGDMGRPNVYFGLEHADVDAKVNALLESFPTQAGKHWFTEETFRSILRIRGIEAGRACEYAEAFYCRKMVL